MLFMPNDVTCRTSCGMPLKQLRGQYTTFLTYFIVLGILGATRLSFAQTVVVGH
jgi:hypothetical protein